MKPILIYKGDDTIFADLKKFLTFNIETNLDLTGWKAKFTLGWITKEISDISSKSFEIILSSEETKNLRLGPQSGSIVLTDSRGHIKTITNSIPFEVTTQVIENEYQEIDLTIPESSGVDIKLKVGAETVTSVNGMTGDVYLYIPSIEGLATEQQLQQGLNTKQNKGDYATNSRVNEVEGLIPDISNLATKEELQDGLDTKQPTGDYALKSEIPTKVSSFTNDANYQTESDVASMIASIPQFKLSIVDSLPETGEKMTLYLVPKEGTNNDVYDEYIWIENTSSFELVGSTAVDLSDYYTKTETNELIPTKTSQLTNDSNYITSSYHDSTKQDKLIEGDNITIVNNVISATGGGGSVNIVQTTGNSTTSVMSQKATTDMPAFKEVVTPTKMLRCTNIQYCTSYDTFDYEDIKVAQVYCRQAYNSYSISHGRQRNMMYQSAISLYKDDNNYLSIYFNRNRLAVRNRKGNVTINEVDLGTIDSGDTSINRPENPAWCAEINLQEKTCIFYVMRGGQLSPFGEVVDISTWDLSHLDTFNIVFGCSEYFGDSFCYYCLLNEKLEIDKIINTPIEYSKYNCYDTYLKNDIKPLQVTGIYADKTASNVSAGTLIEEYNNFHKVFSFSIPENSSAPYYLGLYGQVQGNKHKGQNCIIKCKFLEFAEGAWLKFGQNATYIYKGTEFVRELISISHSFVPELNVEYTFVIKQQDGNPNSQYLLRGVGNFTMETLDMYYMTPQSANICAETWDGNFFRGALPFVGTNVMFSNDYSRITTSRTGLGVPKYFQTTDSNGNIYMYNGTTWKQISN